MSLIDQFCAKNIKYIRYDGTYLLLQIKRFFSLSPNFTSFVSDSCRLTLFINEVVTEPANKVGK